MRAKLKGLHCPEIDDLENWTPDSNSFGFTLQAMIGPSDSKGEESFDLTVCTPDWFAEHRLAGAEVRSGVHTLFVERYDYRALVNFLERAVQRAEADTWDGVAERLSWLGHWEFYDYTP